MPRASADHGEHMNTTGANDGTAPARRVLLVDDSVDAAEALSMLLETLGHEVRTSTTARARSPSSMNSGRKW